MKKTLFTSFLGMAITGAVFAQQNCPHDTSYSYKFVDGSTTKTPVGRTIYFGPSINGGDGDLRSNLYQEFKNAGYVNKSKNEYVLHQPSGGFSEYLYSLWDSATAAWKPNYKEVLTFGSNNLWTELYYQEANQSGVLENIEKYTRTLNAKNRQTNYITSVWKNGAWRNKSQRNNTYQADTLLLLELNQNWDTTGSAWVNDSKTERTFDAAGRETSNAQFSWDANTSAWKGTYMVVRTFNSQGFLSALEELFWNAGTSSFAKAARTLYTPNSAGKSTIDSMQNWNSGANAYISYAVRYYTYNASNELLTYRQLTVNTSGVVTANFLSTRTLDAGNRPLEIFDQDSSSAGGGVWRPSRRWTYSYNANGDKLTEKFEFRQPSADTLSNVNRSTFTYNANNQLLTSLTENWNATTSAWVPGYGSLNEYNNDGKRVASESTNNWNATGNYFNDHNRTEYICKQAGVGIANIAEVEMNIYPNPTNNIINIQTDATIEAVNVYNLQGQNVMSITSNSHQFDMAHLHSGTYIIQINTNKGVARKIISKE